VPLTDAVRQLLLEVDEVWTPSGFGADALQVNFPSEIAVVPLFPWPELIVSDDHDSAAGPCRFLTVVDVSGGLTRSNAWGCIESFRRAFSKIDRGLIAHLTIALHGQPGDEMSSVLQATVDRISGSVIGLSSTVDRLRVIEACDVYVAIGRSDPYGIAVSEAMSFRRPVIATSGYGTPDFATPPAVLLVGAKPEPVSRGAFHLESVNARRFGDGQLWATPDLNSAALSMRHLATDPNARSRIGMNGERRLREARSELRSAKVLRDRVEALQPAALGPLLERVTSTGLR
jgi:glycosyltransferase involved in cell wall biosynthesis